MDSMIGRFASRRILVVGDLMLDEYLWGIVRRISPEAPVPVVELDKRSYAPGGAANAAVNAASLTAIVELVGVIGADEAGRQLAQTIQSHHINAGGLVVEPDRPTTTKTRIIAHNQQVVRVDHERRCPLSDSVEREVLAQVRDRLPTVDGCILSDYDKGMVSRPVARAVIDGCRARGIPVVVDPKGMEYEKYSGATVAKPNLHEAGQILKRHVESPVEVMEAGRRLLELLSSSGVLITCGARGMFLFERGHAPLHIPAQAREVYDVTGAGDTVVSALAVSLAAGASLEQAARLSSRAAGIVVGRLGTAAIQIDEL
jgi:D-beta-D-heptose 7-phosphate kinase/D-beta-D-heptose 1-phosphate adenosyltransferase